MSTFKRVWSLSPDDVNLLISLEKDGRAISIVGFLLQGQQRLKRELADMGIPEEAIRQWDSHITEGVDLWGNFVRIEVAVSYEQ